MRDAQLGAYHGYDIAETVSFTPRFQVLDVLAYYDRQPVLFRYEFYRPADAGHLDRAGPEGRPDRGGQSPRPCARDAPNVGVGRGGRATR